MLLLIKRNTAICKLASLEGYKKKRKMNEFKEKKNGEGRFLRLPRLSYRDETIRVTFAMWYTLLDCGYNPSLGFGWLQNGETEEEMA